MKDFTRHPSSNQTSSAYPSTRWANGVRGIAAIFVMTSHLGLSYADHLEMPRQKDEHARWYNMPFVRIFAEGSPWVSVFLVLTGFVNALKPIQQARAGNLDKALDGLASSAFRRTARLVLPCTVATLFCCVLAEINAFQYGSIVASPWMAGTSKTASKSLWGATSRLVRSIFETWCCHSNDLERNQWAMLYFLEGALMVYIFLLATLRARSDWRMAFAASLVLYSWFGHDDMTFLPIFTGVCVSELSMTSVIPRFAASRSSLVRALPYILLLTGWYCISYPKYKANRMPWSYYMYLFA